MWQLVLGLFQVMIPQNYNLSRLKYLIINNIGYEKILNQENSPKGFWDASFQVFGNQISEVFCYRDIVEKVTKPFQT